MTVEKNKVVAVSYELEVEGQIADKASAEKPLEYIHGTGMLLPKFEEALQGKEPGDTFEFTLSPDEGYGQYDEDYKIDLPKNSFEDPDGKLREDLLVVGYTIPMLNSEGQVVQGTIAAISEECVTMDFNHPMAGKTLHFTGNVVSVRYASEEELQHGLAHKCHCHKGEGHCSDDCKCDGEGECHCGDDCKCGE